MNIRSNKLFPVCFSALLLVQSSHLSVYAQSSSDDDVEVSDEDAGTVSEGTSDSSEDKKNYQLPKKRKLRASELELDDEFKRFKNGHRFRPPFNDRGPRRPFGYGAPKDLFRDFHGHECEEDENDSACALDSDSVSSEGSVKITFTCDDKTYSYYAKVENKAYSLNIPDEVKGLSCKVQIESVKVTDSGTTAEVKGEETTEEVELSDDTTVEINLE